MKRKTLIAMAGAGLIGVAAGIFGLDRYLENNAPESAFTEARKVEAAPAVDFSEFSLGGLLKVIKETKQYEHMTQATKLAIERMDQMRHREVILGFNDQVYTLGDEEMSEEQLQTHLAAPIICHKDSKIFERFQESLGEKRKLVQDNIEWIILSPNVIAQRNGESQEEAGLSIGEGIIYVDTQAGNGQIRDIKEFAPIIAHEAVHESLRGKNPVPSRLENERLAHRAQKEVAEHALTRERSETLEGMINTCDHRIETADYLLQSVFNQDFQGVYPTSMILAGGLLEAEVSQEALGRYLEVNTGNNELDQELATAARIALTLHTHNVKRATEMLYQWMQTGSDLEKKNALSALEFLHPEQLAARQSGAGWYEGKERNSGVSFGFGGGSEGGVLSVPSLSDLLKDARIKKESLFGRLFGSEKRTEQPVYQDVPQGNQVGRLSDEKEQQNAHIRRELESVGSADYRRIMADLNRKLPNVPGDPDGNENDWTYKGYQADRNGTTIVMWQSRSIKIPNPIPTGVSREVFCTKQDRYERGNFVRTTWDFIDPYRDMDFEANPPKFFKQK